MVFKEDKENAINGKQKGQCSKGDKCSFRHDSDDRAKSTPKPLHPLSHQHRSVSRRRNLRGRSPSSKSNRQPCRDYLKGIFNKLPCDTWHPDECQFKKVRTGL